MKKNVVLTLTNANISYTEYAEIRIQDVESTIYYHSVHFCIFPSRI